MPCSAITHVSVGERKGTLYTRRHVCAVVFCRHKKSAYHVSTNTERQNTKHTYTLFG